MLSESDRKKAAQSLITAEAERKPVVQLRATEYIVPSIEIIDARVQNPRFGVTLEPGHVMLSGSFIRPVWANKGDTLHADFGPLGSVAVQFV